MALIKKLLRAIFSFNMLVIIILGFILSNQLGINSRLDILEAQLNPIYSKKCELDVLKKTLANKVVRIIGSKSEGSGFPISKSEIITNYHVIEGEDSPKVVLPDGSIEMPIFVRGNQNEDVAILLLDRTLDPMTSIDPSDSAFGQDVYAAGYPLGSLIEGDVTIVKGTFTGIRQSKNYLIDNIESSINVEKGMSGGPLVNTCGEVLGVTTSGIRGTSYFLNMADVHKTMNKITAEEIEQIKLDLDTPQGLVEAYYYYIRSRDLNKAYELLGSERQAKSSLDDFKSGYDQTLQVNLVNSEVDELNSDKINIKLISGDWVDGERVTKFFEGYWIVKDKKLVESNIKEIEDPSWEWFYGD